MPRRMSAATIRARIRTLEMQARRIERRATKGLRAAAGLIAKHSLSPADLKQAFDMSRGRKRSPIAGRPVPVKYRDPSGNTWTGRGRPPLWLVAAEKTGKKRESFLLGAKKASAKTPRAKSKPKKAAKKRPTKKARP
jgi:DNA-binding protein H-NS